MVTARSKKEKLRTQAEMKDKTDTKQSPHRKWIIILFACLCGIIHRFHVSTLFENDRHFSHLSTLEREMTFRSEMGLYYSYYKTIVEAESFIEGLNAIIYNNITEYPSTINTLKRFNLLPEVLIGGMFRVFEWFCIKLDIKENECWQIDRGNNMPPVLSCEGLRQPEYFYLEAVWFSAMITGFVLYLFGVLISDSIMGGLITVISFFYNHGECTRVQWTPPLRESFAYPFCLLQMLYVSSILKSNLSLKSIKKYKSQLITIALTTSVCLMMWQFSQFFLATQVLSLLLMFGFGFIDEFIMKIILFGEMMGVVVSVILLFGNEMLLSSILVSLLISSTISVKFIYPALLDKKFASFTTIVISILSSVVLKKLLGFSNDDDHIKKILLSKLTDYKDFHTLLYTCSPEYDFLGWEPIKEISLTGLLPAVTFILLVLLLNFFQSSNKLKAIDPHVVYNAVQLGAFAVMAVFVMRLKLFFTPHLCIISSLLAPNKYFNSLRIKELHYCFLAIVVGCMSMYGVENIIKQRDVFGEYSNYGLEELLTWINRSTKETAVFAGAMPVTAAILLSTRRPIVNHPHYEDAGLRERTKMVYSIYSRKPVEEIFSKLSALQVEYVVISEKWCVADDRRNGPTEGCKYVDLWDVEDFENRGRVPTCLDLYVQQVSPYFTKVFFNSQYSVLKLNSSRKTQ